MKAITKKDGTVIGIDSMYTVYIYESYIWVNYNDLTATSLGIMVKKGIIPKWP